MPDTFGLIAETALDGDRLARERDEAEEGRRLAEAAQIKLFARHRRKRDSHLA